jgi:plastocyanin
MRYLIILFLMLVMFSSCKDDATEPSGDSPPVNQVWMRNDLFVPAALTVERGTEVTWVNKDAVQHTVTSSGPVLTFDSGNLSRDQSFSFTFDSTGTYNYHCRLHAGMTGTVIVQ